MESYLVARRTCVARCLLMSSKISFDDGDGASLNNHQIGDGFLATCGLSIQSTPQVEGSSLKFVSKTW